MRATKYKLGLLVLLLVVACGKKDSRNEVGYSGPPGGYGCIGCGGPVGPGSVMAAGVGNIQTDLNAQMALELRVPGTSPTVNNPAQYSGNVVASGGMQLYQPFLLAGCPITAAPGLYGVTRVVQQGQINTSGLPTIRDLVIELAGPNAIMEFRLADVPMYDQVPAVQGYNGGSYPYKFAGTLYLTRLVVQGIQCNILPGLDWFTFKL